MGIQKRKEKSAGILTLTERQHQEDLQRLHGLHPIDDDFMRCLFRKNKVSEGKSERSARDV